jgi:hypothetical protein
LGEDELIAIVESFDGQVEFFLAKNNHRDRGMCFLAVRSCYISWMFIFYLDLMILILLMPKKSLYVPSANNIFARSKGRLDWWIVFYYKPKQLKSYQTVKS